MKQRPETVVVSLGRPTSPGEPLSHPIVPVTAYRAGGEHAYGRDFNPSWEPLEQLVGELEGGTGVSFATGLAASAAVLESVPTGAAVVASRSGYFGVTQQLAAREATGRITVRWVDTADLSALSEAVRGAHLVWVETPSNPMMRIVDLVAAAGLCRDGGALLAVDNTFATPLLQQPISLGADVVVHSASKYLSGHSDALTGVAVCARAQDAEGLRQVRSREGAVTGALESFLVLRGIRTLAVRMERAQASAGLLAHRLSEHPAVACVRYPGLAQDPGHEIAARQMSGFGAMLSFEMVGDAAAAQAVCERVELITHATSLGGVETLIERRARYDAERANGTPESLLRLSVGIEHVEDLWADLEKALAGP